MNLMNIYSVIVIVQQIMKIKDVNVFSPKYKSAHKQEIINISLNKRR